MDRIPLSDETLTLDDDVVEDEGSPGKEEQFEELDFDADIATTYIPEPWGYEDEDYSDANDLDDEFIVENDL